MEAAPRDPVLDRIVADPEESHLPQTDDAVLHCGELRDDPIDTWAPFGANTAPKSAQVDHAATVDDLTSQISTGVANLRYGGVTAAMKRTSPRPRPRRRSRRSNRTSR